MRSLLPFDYEVEVNLPYGFTVKDTLNPNSYSGTDSIDIDIDSFPKKEIDKIETQIKNDLTTLYNSAIENKSYEEIKNNFSFEGDLNEMQEVYEDLKDNISSSFSTTLTNIEYQSSDITDIEMTSDGLLSLTVRVKYKYTISYEEDGETKTKETTDTDSIYLTYGYQDKTYKIVDASSLTTYFSRYF